MPIVPLYPVDGASPQRVPNSGPTVPAAGEPAMSGADRARDLHAARQQVGQSNDSLAALHERTAREANDTRVQDLNNRFLDGRREILQAYYDRTGADAIQGADATTGKLTALRDAVFGQTANGYQRQRLGPILDTHLADASAGIMRHTARQQDVYARGVATAAIEISRTEARTDPANLANAVLRAEGAARVLHVGQPLEAIEAGVHAAGGSVIAGAIGDRLSRNDPLGVGLFRRYADRLDPTDRRTLGAAAETLSNTLDAVDWLRDRSATLRASAPTGEASASTAEPALPDGDGIVGTRERLAGIEEHRRALTSLNESEFAANSARLRANQAAIDTDTVRRRAAVKGETDDLYTDLRRHLMTGGPSGGPAITLPPATIMSRLSDAQQDAVTAQIAANIEGRRPSTDPQTWYAIHQGLTRDEAGERQRWASMNLVPFMGRLSDEDYAALEKLQWSVRSNTGSAEQSRLQLITRMASATLRSMGIDPTPHSDAALGNDAAQAARFHRAVHDELSAFQRSGRTPTGAEAHGIIKRLQDTGIEIGWLKANDASPAGASDIPPTDEAFHQPGAQVAQAEPAELPGQRPGTMIGLAPDYESFRRQMEEHRQREAAEQAAAGLGGFEGAPGTEPVPGSPVYRDTDVDARAIGAEQDAEEVGGQDGAPLTGSPPGSPDHREAEERARKRDEDGWEKLGFFEQLGIAFKRFDAESRKSGAALKIDTSARQLEKVLELGRRQDAGEELNVTEKRYLLKNRNTASNLAGAVARLAGAQARLDELPASDPLRRLLEAPSVAEAARLLHRHPGKIARAVGVEGVPALTVGLIATAVLGPIGGAIALTGSSGVDGYAKGLLGALARAGVDVSDADDLTRALRDNGLMERIREDAMTDGAIAAGVTAASMMLPIPKSSRRAPLSLVMKVPAANAEGRGFPTFKKFKEAIGKAPPGYAWHHIVAQTTENIKRFGAENIHNTNNLVLLPHGPGTIHNKLSALYGSKKKFSGDLIVKNWLADKSFEEQAVFGRKYLKRYRKEAQ